MIHRETAHSEESPLDQPQEAAQRLSSAVQSSGSQRLRPPLRQPYVPAIQQQSDPRWNVHAVNSDSVVTPAPGGSAYVAAAAAAAAVAAAAPLFRPTTDLPPPAPQHAGSATWEQGAAAPQTQREGGAQLQQGPDGRQQGGYSWAPLGLAPGQGGGLTPGQGAAAAALQQRAGGVAAVGASSAAADARMAQALAMGDAGALLHSSSQVAALLSTHPPPGKPCLVVGNILLMAPPAFIQAPKSRISAVCFNVLCGLPCLLHQDIILLD